MPSTGKRHGARGKGPLSRSHVGAAILDRPSRGRSDAVPPGRQAAHRVACPRDSRGRLGNARPALRCPRRGETLRAMCNLYSITKGQQAIRDLVGAMRDLTGNLPMLPGVFPDYSAPIVRTAKDGVREIAMARWGMPSPAFAIAGKSRGRNTGR
jgi:hypothetical protein